jgi:two-component system chemotaxis response regulator CheY
MDLSNIAQPTCGMSNKIARIRQAGGFGFIIVTGRADANMIANGRALGLNNLINKPFTKEQLRRCIESVTGPLA